MCSVLVGLTGVGAQAATKFAESLTATVSEHLEEWTRQSENLCSVRSGFWVRPSKRACACVRACE